MMLPPPLTTHQRCRQSQRKVRAMIFCSLVSWTCASAFTPMYVHTSSAASTAAATGSSYRHLHPATTSSSSRSAGHHLSQVFAFPKKKNSPLEDEPWKKDDSYWDQLQAASKDPERFEKFIEETMAKKKMVSSSSSSLSSAYSAAAKAQEETTPKKKKGAYVPIEQWDAQHSENMSKEERLQWECQRNGNQFRQNEILMHNLKSF